jgi:hypothetical protein
MHRAPTIGKIGWVKNIKKFYCTNEFYIIFLYGIDLRGE